MNDEKLNRLFRAARGERAPAPPADFGARVTREIRRLESQPAPGLMEQVGLLFPRLATVSLAVVAVCIAFEVGMAAAGQPDLTTAAAQLSDPWLFTAEGM
jgi:hypothetical protein